MKKLILGGIVILGLATGCGSVRMSKIEFDSTGSVVSKSEIKYNVIGSRTLGKADVNLLKGTAKIGKQSADSGKLGELLSNAGKLMIETSKIIAAGTVGGVVVK